MQDVHVVLDAGVGVVGAGWEGEANPQGRGRACFDCVGLRRSGGFVLYGAEDDTGGTEGYGETKCGGEGEDGSGDPWVEVDDGWRSNAA